MGLGLAPQSRGLVPETAVPMAAAAAGVALKYGQDIQRPDFRCLGPLVTFLGVNFVEVSCFSLPHKTVGDPGVTEEWQTIASLLGIQTAAVGGFMRWATSKAACERCTTA